jgi:hypothetical protein
VSEISYSERPSVAPSPPEEAGRLLVCVPLFWWDHVLTFLGTGLRFGELADLRHTFSTWLEDAGIPARVIDELMGHERSRRGELEGGSRIGALSPYHAGDGRPCR